MKDEQLFYFEESSIFKAMMHFSLPMMIYHYSVLFTES